MQDYGVNIDKDDNVSYSIPDAITGATSIGFDANSEQTDFD